MDMVSQTFQIKTVLPIKAGCGTPPRQTRARQVEQVTSSVPEHLKADLQRLYAEKFFCDFKLVAGSETFCVHRSILSARSQVFSAMFDNEMLEKSSDLVVIPDVDEETMSRMLLFMYTGNVEELKLESAMKLYFAADKYQLLSLKFQSSLFLELNLTVSNVWDVLVLADIHHDEDLIKRVKDFIFSQDHSMVLSSEWTQFKERHSNLTCDIAVEMYKKSRRTRFRRRRRLIRINRSQQMKQGIFNLTDHLKDDLQRLYTEKSFCDYKLEAGSESFHVHRSILSARSKVFCAMFNNETLENSSDSLTILDIDKETLNRVLLFMYTDTVEQLDFENVVKLYFAADKYQLPSFKFQCSSLLKSNITTLNVCEVLILAELHHDQSLITAVKDFIYSHDRDVVFSSEFNELKENHSKLTCDIVVEMYKKRLDPEEHFSLCKEEVSNSTVDYST